MKVNTRKDWIRISDVESIISSAVSLGMMYMKEKISTEELKEEKRLMINELNLRISKNKYP